MAPRLLARRGGRVRIAASGDRARTARARTCRRRCGRGGQKRCREGWRGGTVPRASAPHSVSGRLRTTARLHPGGRHHHAHHSSSLVPRPAPGRPQCGDRGVQRRCRRRRDRRVPFGGGLHVLAGVGAPAGRVRRDVSAVAAPGLQEARFGEALVGAGHRRRVDAQIARELAHGGEVVSGRQPTARDQPAEAGLDLAPDRLGAARVSTSSSGGIDSMYQYIDTLARMRALSKPAPRGRSVLAQTACGIDRRRAPRGADDRGRRDQRQGGGHRGE